MSASELLAAGNLLLNRRPSNRAQFQFEHISFVARIKHAKENKKKNCFICCDDDHVETGLLATLCLCVGTSLSSFLFLPLSFSKIVCRTVGVSLRSRDSFIFLSFFICGKIECSGHYSYVLFCWVYTIEPCIAHVHTGAAASAATAVAVDDVNYKIKVINDNGLVCIIIL